MYDIHCARLSYMAAEALQQQNQTLSLRISEALRKRLEDIRKLTGRPQGRKRLHVGDRQATAGVGARRPLRGGRTARQACRVAAGDPAQGPGRAVALPGAVDGACLLRAAGLGGLRQESSLAGILIGILKAFDAVHELRAKPSEQDEYYLGNLPTDCRPERSRSDAATPEVVRKTVAETVRRLSNPATKWTPHARRP